MIRIPRLSALAALLLAPLAACAGTAPPDSSPDAVEVTATPVAEASAVTVYVVRHAERADEPGPDPALSAAGEARARALADQLADAGIDAIVVSPFRRTALTAAPLAERIGVTPVAVPVQGGMEAHLRGVVEAVRARPAGDAVLVVGHSNTVPAIVAALGGPAMADLTEEAYGDLFVLTLPAEGETTLERRTF